MTNTNLCMIELGLPTLKSLVKQRQRKFFKNMWADRQNMYDDPLNLSLRLTMSSNTSTSRYVKDLLDINVNDTSEAMNNLIQDVISSVSSKCIYYKLINPNLHVHDTYKIKFNIDERERMSWSRLRLSAHSLAIENG